MLEPVRFATLAAQLHRLLSQAVASMGLSRMTVRSLISGQPRFRA